MPSRSYDENGILATPGSNYWTNPIDVIKIENATYYRLDWVDAPSFYKDNGTVRIPGNFSISGCWLATGASANWWYDKHYWRGDWEDEGLGADPLDPMSARPAMVFDGPIYIENVPTIDPTEEINGSFELSATGGYLGSVEITLELDVSSGSIDDFKYPTGASASPIESKLSVLGILPGPYTGGIKISNLFTKQRTLVNTTPSFVSGAVYLDPPIPTTAYSGSASGSGDHLYLNGSQWETRKDLFEGDEMTMLQGFLGSDVKSYVFNNYGLQQQPDVSGVEKYASYLNGSALNILCNGASWSSPKFQINA